MEGTELSGIRIPQNEDSVNYTIMTSGLPIVASWGTQKEKRERARNMVLLKSLCFYHLLRTRTKHIKSVCNTVPVTH